MVDQLRGREGGEKNRKFQNGEITIGDRTRKTTSILGGFVPEPTNKKRRRVGRIHNRKQKGRAPGSDGQCLKEAPRGSFQGNSQKKKKGGGAVGAVLAAEGDRKGKGDH